jgi:hypothetical protein
MFLALLLATALEVKPGQSIPDALSKFPKIMVLLPGDHILKGSIVLDVRHSGLTIQGKGARLVGGALISNWRKAQGEVLVADLPVPAAPLRSRGFGRPTTSAHTELFFDGKRMTLARWPNKGSFERIASTPDPNPPDDGHGKRLGRVEFGFQYEGDRPTRWKRPELAWVHGYWAWDWAETYEQIVKLDTAKRQVRTGGGQYGFRGGQRYYFLNILEELDEPGEYYVDAEAAKVYFWPPAPIAGKEIAVSSVEKPLLEIRGASNIAVEGVGFQYTRGNAVEVHESRDIALRQLDIRDIGNNGIVVRGGANVRVEHSTIAYTGDGGLELTGGDRRTLKAAGHAATDNHLHDFGEWSKTYNPAIKVNGVGNVLAHNLMHDSPHAGIVLTGNEHRIEFNEMHHLAKETGDVGAFYLGRDFTERGNIVRHNFIHHIGGVGSIGSMAVYLDDCSSGTTVFGNIFYKVQRAAFVGGGRDNRIENNLFIECTTPVHVDSRGLSQKAVWQNMVYKTMMPKVEEMNPDAEPYRSRYPQLQDLKPYFAKPGGVPPEGTRIRRNIVYGAGFEKWLKMYERAPEFVKDVADNIAEAAIGVVDPDKPDFTFKDPEKARKIGFEPIPWREIGPRWQ